MPEILAMSDRILVIHEGTVARVFERAEATREKIPPARRGIEDLRFSTRARTAR